MYALHMRVFCLVVYVILIVCVWVYCLRTFVVVKVCFVFAFVCLCIYCILGTWAGS